jgi:uncharacterized membrane protein
VKSHHPDRQAARTRREQFADTPPSSPGARKPPSWNVVIIAAALVFVAAVLFVTRMQPVATASGGTAIDRGGDVTFALSDFADGQARFFRYVSASGKEIRFFIIRSSDGVTRAAFDTCDVCYRERRGYRQSGDEMICNNCSQAFRSTSINELRGGCNPAPLDRAIQGDRIVLRAAALEQGAFYF